MNNAIRIKNFIESEWVDYADYDNRRSLPHIMDGLKVTQRKAIYTATKLPKDSKAIRVSQFAAKASEITAYHHGESSMVKAVVGLAQDHPGKNNFPLLEKHGQFGTRLSSEAGGPRYIHTKLHKNFDLLFLPEDQEVVEYLYEDGEQIEPKFFIPVVPTLLLNGCDAVGNGYKSIILNYNIKDVIKCIKEIIKYGKVKSKLIPYTNNWNGDVSKTDKQIIFSGKLDVVNSRKIIITELPPSYDRTKYKSILNNLVEQKIIKDYENNSTEDKWEWVIHCSKELTELPLDELLIKFSLITKVTENIVCWVDEDSPTTFDTVEQLLERWYVERIKLYKKSIECQIANIESQIIESTLRKRFISWCWKSNIKDLSKKQLIDKSVSEIKSMTTVLSEKFVNIPLYKLTKEEYEKLSKAIEELVDKLEVLEKSTPESVMLENLESLK